METWSNLFRQLFDVKALGLPISDFSMLLPGDPLEVNTVRAEGDTKFESGRWLAEIF
jgi:hypothetical protein